MNETQETHADSLEAARKRAREDRDYAKSLDMLAGVLGDGTAAEQIAGRRVDNLPSLP